MELEYEPQNSTKLYLYYVDNRLSSLKTFYIITYLFDLFFIQIKLLFLYYCTEIYIILLQ